MTSVPGHSSEANRAYHITDFKWLLLPSFYDPAVKPGIATVSCRKGFRTLCPKLEVGPAKQLRSGWSEGARGGSQFVAASNRLQTNRFPGRAWHF